MRQPIVIVGASGHGSVIADICIRQGSFDILGFIDTFKPPGPDRVGLILGPEEILPELQSRYSGLGCIVAIGDNSTRALVVAKIESLAPRLPFITAIHPSAEIGSGVCLGVGSAVMAGAVVNVGTHFGAHCIVNTSASVDHDNRWGDFASIGPGGTTGGNVTVGEYSVIAQRAVVLHGCIIGPHTVIGASATVIDNIPGNVVAYGTPARVVRTRQPGDKYL